MIKEKVVLTIEKKLEFISLLQKGNIPEKYEISQSTIASIKKSKES